MIGNYIEKQYEPYHKIYDHNGRRGHAIYLGDVASSQDMEFIKQKNIKTVVTASLGMDYLHFGPDINHIVYPLLDAKSQNISQFFMHFIEMVERQLERGSVLVHCFAGVSRSATLVIAFLMQKYEWSFKQAIDHVRKSRTTACPNLGFERQLKELHIFLKTKNTNSATQRKYQSKTSASSNYQSINGEKKILPNLNLDKQRARLIKPTVICFPIGRRKNTFSLDIEVQQKQEKKLALRPYFKTKSNLNGKIEYTNKNTRIQKQRRPINQIKLSILSKLDIKVTENKFKLEQ